MLALGNRAGNSLPVVVHIGKQGWRAKSMLYKLMVFRLGKQALLPAVCSIRLNYCPHLLYMLKFYCSYKQSNAYVCIGLPITCDKPIEMDHLLNSWRLRLFNRCAACGCFKHGNPQKCVWSCSEHISRATLCKHC